MANCPKCGEHLKLTDWKQHCPHCNCNVVIYDIQERLMQDADKAEVQHYYFQKKVDRLKASFIGSKLAVARIFTSFIPLIAVIVPWFKAVFKAPFTEFDGFFGLFSVLDVLDSIDVDGIVSLLDTTDGKAAVICLLSAAVVFLLSLVIVLVRFFCITMACGKHGKQRMYVFDIAMLVLCIVGSLLLLVVPENPYFDIGFILAPIVYFILLCVNFGVDMAIYKKGIEIKHAPCFVGGIPIEEYFGMLENGVPAEEIRQEMYRRLTEMQLQKEAELNKEVAQNE